MSRRKPNLRRRRYKRLSQRKLTTSDLLVFEFLWTWKVATTPMLKIVAFKNKSDWWVYKALRQLKKEKYIQALPRGKYLEQELWALTEHGFEHVLLDRDDIYHYRYRPHAPAHDYFATTLQLGNMWLSPGDKDREFFTEQMLASLRQSNFPKEIRIHEEGHVPDGVTIFSHERAQATVIYEVDLNLKDDSRYAETRAYFRNANADLVVWLVRNAWIASKIGEIIKSTDRIGFQGSKTYFDKVAFILLEDFKEKIWDAKVIMGPLKDMTVRKLHANLLQSLGKVDANISQKPMQQIYFSKYKSPQKLIA